MARAARFNQADATRALRAAVAAGLKPSGFKIAADGSIEVHFESGTARAASKLDEMFQ